MNQRKTVSARLLALCTFVAVMGCQDGNEGMTTGAETGAPAHVEGCFPSWDVVDGDSADPDPEGDVFACSGSGNGWIRTIIYITGPNAGQNAITRYKCVNPPPGVKPEDITEQHCMEKPLDLRALDISTGGSVSDTDVCCGATTEPSAVADACVVDCAYAACKLAVVKLRQAAEETANEPTKSDVLGFAELLSTPLMQDVCAGKTVKAAPNVMTWSLGEGVSSDQFGHVENLTLNLQCDVEVATEQSNVCRASANTPEAPD